MRLFFTQFDFRFNIDCMRLKPIKVRMENTDFDVPHLLGLSGFERSLSGFEAEAAGFWWPLQGCDTESQRHRHES